MARCREDINSAPSPSVFYNTQALSTIAEVRDFIENPNFPCVGAKAALAQGAVTFRVYEDLASRSGSAGLHFDLMEYIESLNVDDPRIQSFLAIFPESQFADEESFEQGLFEQLKQLTHESNTLAIDWNSQVSADPENPHFSMSIAGHPFFIVGMHPKSSRAARQTPYPVLVFNSNLQFDKLREDGRFDKLKTIIRQRDYEINGSINPMLDDFGQSSEVRQYSGRHLDDDWKCPFDPQSKAAENIIVKETK